MFKKKMQQKVKIVGNCQNRGKAYKLAFHNKMTIMRK